MGRALELTRRALVTLSTYAYIKRQTRRKSTGGHRINTLSLSLRSLEKQTLSSGSCQLTLISRRLGLNTS
jgi:hypothetical protein